MNGQEFYSKVFGLQRNLIIAYDSFLVQLGTGEVKDFQPDPRSKKLSSFLTGLSCSYDNFMKDSEND